MARLQLHDQLRVNDLSQVQLNALSALLSAPNAAPKLATPVQPFTTLAALPPPAAVLPASANVDPIDSLIIEEDLKRQTRADIAHHKTVGTLTGRYHAMGLPVRGQRNRTNGKTAKRLNRIERRGYSSFAHSSSGRYVSASSSSGMTFIMRWANPGVSDSSMSSTSTGTSVVLNSLRSLYMSAGTPTSLPRTRFTVI